MFLEIAWGSINVAEQTVCSVVVVFVDDSVVWALLAVAAKDVDNLVVARVEDKKMGARVAVAVLEAVEFAAVAKLLSACLQLALPAVGLECLRLLPWEVLLKAKLAKLFVFFQICFPASIKIA